MGKHVFLFITLISVVKKDVVLTQCKEELPPSLEEMEEKEDSKEAL